MNHIGIIQYYILSAVLAVQSMQDLGLLQDQFPHISILSYFSPASNTSFLQIIFNIVQPSPSWSSNRLFFFNSSLRFLRLPDWCKLSTFNVPVTFSLFLSLTWLVPEDLSGFYLFFGFFNISLVLWCRSLAPHSIPTLENVGIPLSLGHHPRPVRQGRHCQ
jgi:hypothetical protein